MADDSTRADMLMVIIDPTTSKAVPGESRAQVHKDDDGGKDFLDHKNYFDVFELDFGISLGGTEYGNKSKQSGDGWEDRSKSVNVAAQAGAPTPVQGMPVRLENVRFKKQMDGASPILFRLCSIRKEIPKAILIRRKSVGGIGAPVYAQTFLRIVFERIQLISVTWDLEADSNEESVVFTCRKVSLAYSTQTEKGQLIGGREPQYYDYDEKPPH